MKKRFAAISAAVLALALAPAAPPAMAGTSYPGCDISIPLRDAWPMTDAPGSSTAADTIRSVNSLHIAPNWGVAPYVTFDGTWAHASDSGSLIGDTNIELGGGDWVFAGTIKTNDGLYNWAQFGLTQNGGGASPIGFVKLTAAYVYIQGTLGDVRINSNRNYSDGLKHYVCAQRVGNVFSYYIDGVLMGTKTIDIGLVNVQSVKLMIMAKYWPNGSFDPTDALNGYSRNFQLAWRS